MTVESTEDLFKKDSSESTFNLKDENESDDKEEKKEGESKEDDGKEGDSSNQEGTENTGEQDNIPFHKHPRFKKIMEELKDLREKDEEKSSASSEAEKFKASSSDELPPHWVALFGDDEKSAKAWKIQQKHEEQLVAQAEERAINRIQESQKKEVAEQRKWERFIDDQLTTIEDTYDVDLTSDKEPATKARNEILKIVSELSPKDDDGNVTSFIPFDKAYEIYELKKGSSKKPDASAKKEASARSMSKSESASTEKEEDTSGGFGFNGSWREKYFKGEN